MDIPLEEISNMPLQRKGFYLKEYRNYFAEKVIDDLFHYQKGESTSSKLYPFFNKDFKLNCYEIIKDKLITNREEEKYNHYTKNEVINALAKMHRYFKNDSFAPSLLRSTIRNTLSLDATDFQRNQDIIGLLYSSTMSHPGNGLSLDGKIDKDFLNAIASKKSEELMPHIISVIPFQFNIERIRPFSVNFFIDKEATYLNTLANTVKNNVFFRDMAMETMSRALIDEHIILKTYVNKEFMSDINKYIVKHERQGI